MMKLKTSVLLALLGAFTLLFNLPVRADDDDDDDDGRERKSEHRGERGGKREGERGGKAFAPVTDKTYADECSACHMAYPPGLLPEKSWERIMGGLPKHFNEDVDLDQKTRDTIAKYLRDNAAEKSTNERSRKILQSIKGDPPLRISETPYIRGKHHEIKDAVFARKSIESRGNCSACHTTARDGIFTEGNVKIPK
ncbi:MAG: diheme cytochrome c [Kiritimatiellia bacterium]